MPASMCPEGSRRVWCSPRCAWEGWDTSRIMPMAIGGETWSGVQVWTDHPAASCMASQYAGWAINPDGFFAMGSGPLRARARVEKELFEKLGYARGGPRGVLVLEGRDAADRRGGGVGGAEGRRVAGRLTFAVAPTASLAGGVQIVARVIETGLHKMDTLGFDVRRVVSAIGHRADAPRREERSARHRPHQRLRALWRPGALHRPGRRRRAGAAGGAAAVVDVARLRHAVLRHLQAIRQRLL